MSRGKSWLVICSFAILAISLIGVCLAVTPVAAYATQFSPTTFAGSLATTLHDQGVNLAGLPPVSPISTRPLADSCLLCYSPSHHLLNHISELFQPHPGF